MIANGIHSHNCKECWSVFVVNMSAQPIKGHVFIHVFFAFAIVGIAPEYECIRACAGKYNYGLQPIAFSKDKHYQVRLGTVSVNYFFFQ